MTMLETANSNTLGIIMTKPDKQSSTLNNS